MLVQFLEGIPHLICCFLLGNVWYYMVLDPVKDDTLGPRHCLLVLVVIIGVNSDNYNLLGEVLNTNSVNCG